MKKLTGVSTEAIDRFIERYPDGSDRSTIVPRLQLALQLAREGKAKRRDYAEGYRWIFDVELPADKWHAEPYTVRILADGALTIVVTVLPPMFRDDMRRKVRQQFHRREVEEISEVAEVTPVEVSLPAPVKVGLSLGDKLRQALGR